MNNFIQTTVHDLYMYAKFECVEVYRFLQINTSRCEFYEFYRRQ
jgi:predicted nucleic-acid-binding Zn-ribbon protein